MSDENNGHNQGSRPAKNIKGLLRFCMEATRGEDAPNTRIVEPMSEERKQWLENAFRHMTVSPVERMSVCLQVIEAAEVDTAEGTEQTVKALEELQDWAEDMDTAADFIKIGGLRVLPLLLSSEVSELRWRGLELLGTLVQNNPNTQAAVCKVQLLPALLALADLDHNPRVRVKALFSVSCLVRTNPAGQKSLLDSGGIAVLVRALNSEEEKARVKAAFLASALCIEDPSIKDVFVNCGAVEALARQLAAVGDDEEAQHLLACLHSLVDQHPAAWQHCQDPELHLTELLSDRLEKARGREECQEEREFADKLLQYLRGPAPPPRVSTSTSLMLAS